MDIREDVGPQVLEYLFSSLKIDAEWSIRESRRFTWWAHRLAQKVWAEPARIDEGYAVVRVHAEIDLLKDVPKIQRTFERLNAFNAFGVSMSAFVFQPEDHCMGMHCAAYFHEENAQWLSRIFSAAVAIQAADAHIKADGAASLLDGRPDESRHPTNGMRKEPDDMLNVIEALFAPAGRGASAFGKEDFTSALDMEPSPWVLASPGDSGMTAEFPFPGCMPPTALLRVSAEEKHRQLGSGALFVLRLPVSLHGVNGEELANKLNCAEAVEWTRFHYFGGWCKDPDGNLAFVSFIPSALRKPGLLENLLYSMAHRARWSNEFLASEEGIPHKFQGRDEAPYHQQLEERSKLANLFLDALLKRKKERPKGGRQQNEAQGLRNPQEEITFAEFMRRRQENGAGERQTSTSPDRGWVGDGKRKETPKDGQLSFNELADQLMSKRQWAAARFLLEEAIREMPKDWGPVRDDSDLPRALICAFWDIEEFMAYVKAKEKEGYLVRWIAGSYSKAWYQLAAIAVEEGNLESALGCLESGFALEPDHPQLWNEKGYILSRQGRYEDALRSYERAATVRDWAPASQIARALRGKGSALVDLKRLDEAEEAIKRSLVLDPESKMGTNELEYITQLRRVQAEGSA